MGRISLVKVSLIVAIGGSLHAGWMNAAAQTSFPNPTSKEAANTSAPADTLGTTVPTTSSAWRQLPPLQRQALAPLGAQWSALTVQQQTKWIAISKNFTQLSVADQITMHSRMADWIDLSPQQRNLARLNFNHIQSLPKLDKKAQWEAYQALSAEEKRSLSERTASPSKSAAPTIKPLEAHRQVQTTAKASTGGATTASAIDRKTLLPRPSTLAAPNRTPPLPTSTDVPETIKPPSETAPS